MSEVNERSSTGKLVKNLFIGFNVIMLIWLLYFFATKPEVTGDSMSSGFTALGNGVSELLILGSWAIGAAILGAATYMTRAK